jgi:hypothetical protein
MTIFLLADRELPVPPDKTAYPCLVLDRVIADGQAMTLVGIRKVAPAPFAYSVSLNGYCGCYFGYMTAEAFGQHLADRKANPDVEYADTAEQAEAMWQALMTGMVSFGRYVAEHASASLAVYVAWENCAGQKEPNRAEVPPSYFGGPGFESLAEDLLLTIIPESDGRQNVPWDPAAPRTHEWLQCGKCG